MRSQILSILLMLGSPAAAAQPVEGSPPATTMQCIDVSGHIVPPVCNSPASRIDASEFICICQAPAQRVEAPICAKGEEPPPETNALNNVRRGAIRDGTLIGDTIDGRPICAAPRRP